MISKSPILMRKEVIIMKKKLLLAISLLVVFILVLTGCNSSDYKKAISLYENGSYEEAAAAFEALGDYQDSKKQLVNCYYTLGEYYLDDNSFDQALSYFIKAQDNPGSQKSIRVILSKLLGGDFHTHFSNANGAYSTYVTNEINRYKNFVLDYMMGRGESSFSFDYSNEKLSKMEIERSLMAQSLDNINQLFNADVLSVCDNKTKTALEEANKLMTYANGLYIKNNVVSNVIYLVDSKQSKPAFTTDGMLEVVKSFDSCVKELQ